MPYSFKEESEPCPKCQTIMRHGEAPFRVDDTIIGHYDAMRCPNCGYFYFTDKDYDRMMEDAKAIRAIPRTFIVPKTESMSQGSVMPNVGIDTTLKH